MNRKELRSINENLERPKWLEFKAVLRDMVIQIREDLANEYNTAKGAANEYYSGLCFVAVVRLTEMVDAYAKEHNVNMKCHDMHGEQKHSPKISSKHWGTQHTWAVVTKDDMTVYVDPTSSQFKDIWSDIPDYYISRIPAPWYYYDRDNPALNGITKKLDRAIQIPIRVKDEEGTWYRHDGLIEFFQYEVWGHISDMIRRFILRKEP